MKDLAGNTSLGNRFSHRSWLQGKSTMLVTRQEIADAQALASLFRRGIALFESTHRATVRRGIRTWILQELAIYFLLRNLAIKY